MRCSFAILAITIPCASPLTADEKDAPKYEFKLKAVDVKNTDTPLAKLLKERYNAAIDFALDEMARIQEGRFTVMALGEAMDLMVGAGLELFSDPKERLAVLDESLRYSQHAEKITTLRYEAGAVPKSDVVTAKYIRLTAEIRILREKETKRR